MYFNFFNSFSFFNKMKAFFPLALILNFSGEIFWIKGGAICWTDKVLGYILLVNSANYRTVDKKNQQGSLSNFTHYFDIFTKMSYYLVIFNKL